MFYVCVCVMCIHNTSIHVCDLCQDAMDSDDSEDVWGTKWGVVLNHMLKDGHVFHPVDLNGIMWSIFDYIYIYFMYPCLYLQLL